MTQNCIFCRIIQGDIPSPKLYEDESCICIRDIQPQAKVHLLVIPKKHIATLSEAFPENGLGETTLLGRLLEVGTRLARQEKLLPLGFRTVINTEKGAGQTVFHIHLHLLGGELLKGSFGS